MKIADIDHADDIPPFGTNSRTDQTTLRTDDEQCTEDSPITGMKQPKRSSLLRARDFIWQYYAENLTLDELSVVTGLTRFHLVRAFAGEFGMPPHAYLNQVRLAKAKKLIAGGIPLALVAAQVGFADQSHFTRHFVKTYGVTPAEYAGKDRKRDAMKVIATRYLGRKYRVASRRNI